MYIPGIPKELVEQTQEALKLPEGTIEFRYQSNNLFDPGIDRGILMQIPSGENLLRLERDSNLDLHFFHSSPGTNTRVATVSLNSLKDSKALRITLVWSLEKIGLCVADANNPHISVSRIGEPSNRKFRVGADGSVFEIGNKNVEVMELRVRSKGKTILEPIAIETWNNTVKAVEILQTGSSSEGYIFENVTTNMAIVMLVTGFETYCKKRFLELESEGIKPDQDSLFREFLSSRERERSLECIGVRRRCGGISPIHKLVSDRRIDFGNWEDCKRAYNKGYGIKFGEDLRVQNMALEELQRLIYYRNRIVHVSPLLGMLNQDKVPPEEPVFANRQYSQNALRICKEFIQGLHKATLNLKHDT